MHEWFLQTVEYQKFGWNITFISSIAIGIFTLVEAWGVWSQCTTIWSKKKGETLSVPWFAYDAGFCALFSIYGVYNYSISAMINGGLIALLHVPILIGLWKYRGFVTRDWIVFTIACVMPVLMIVLAWKDTMYFISVIAVLFVLMTQPWELIKEKKRGNLDGRLIVGYLICGIFWIIYACAFETHTFVIIATIMEIIWFVTAVLWYRCEK